MRLLSILVIACSCAGDPIADEPPTPDAGEVPEQGPEYDRVFALDRVVEVDIRFHDDGWEVIRASPFEDIYVPADLSYDGVEVANVAVRIKGNSSRNNTANQGGLRYSLKLNTDYYVDDQTLFGLDKLNFNNGTNDPTQLREVISTELFRAAGIPSPQMGFVRLSINGELIGFYVAVEQEDKDFLRRHFDDDDGDLYKPEPPSGHLGFRGDRIEDYPGLEIKTNETTTDHSAVLRFIDVLSNTSDAELEQALAAVFDVDLFLRYLAVSALHVNLDSPLGPGHNYYLYEDRSTGRFVLLPWDLNGTFGTFDCGQGNATVDFSYAQPACAPTEQKILIDRILSVAAYRAAYEAYLTSYAQTLFDVDTVAARVTELADVARAAVWEDPNRFFSAEQFEQNLTTDVPRGMGPGMGGDRVFFGLTSFAERRQQALDDQL